MRRCLPLLALAFAACSSESAAIAPSFAADGGEPDAAASSEPPDASSLDPDAGSPGADAGPVVPNPYVFVIAMENKAASDVYGSADAPYINQTLMKQYAWATAYGDDLSGWVPSEPHYVWMEAGTNKFSDYSFWLDSDPGGTNSTDDTRHFVTQLASLGKDKDWRSYQQGLDAATTGACPINSAGVYAAKHDPFVFFTDVSGSPPSATNAFCASHHRAFTRAKLEADLAAGDVAAYTFITPDLCHDMHGNSKCTNGCTAGTDPACVSEGDKFLAANVPPILAFLQAHGGVLFIQWDEPEGGSLQPFLVVGPKVKPGHPSKVAYTHSSFLKSLEKIFGLPVSSRVSGANDFADFFVAGGYP